MTQTQTPQATTDTAPPTGTPQLLPVSFNRYGYHIHQLQRNEMDELR